MTNPVLEVYGLQKCYGARTVLHGVDLILEAGEVVCLIGPSGCGKSTLLWCINHLTDCDDGVVKLDGQNIGHNKPGWYTLTRARALMGMVFQDFSLWPHLTALQNIMKPQQVVLGRSKALARRRATDLLERIGLSEKADAFPGELSGGQQQRIAIARALAMDPRLMLFDEPTASLDPERVKDVLEIMRELAADGMTMLVVTHELGFARELGDRVIFLDEGRIVEQGTPTEMLEHPRSERLRRFLSRLDHHRQT